MVVLIVHLTIKPGAAEECIRLCRALAQESRQEPGCLQYIVQQSTGNPLHLCLYEQYQDDAALQAHRASPHFTHYIKGGGGIEALVESLTRELFLPLG
jgi:quinol monooxygenase YgiN